MIEAILNINADNHKAHQKEIHKAGVETINPDDAVNDSRKNDNLVPKAVKKTSSAEESRNDISEEIKKEMKNISSLESNTSQSTQVGSIIDEIV